MKKTTILFFVLVEFCCNAQWMPTGNNVLPNEFLGSNNNQPLRIRTQNAERVRIFGNGLSPSAPLGGGLGIHFTPGAPIIAPASLLHIGLPTAANLTGLTGAAGWRNWMSIGGYMHDGSDNLYVGLKYEGNFDRQDAVIDWGDNATGGPSAAPDYLRFIFTGNYNNGAVGTAGSLDGLEVMRCSPFGRVGIGNYYNNPLNTSLLEPARRLEVLSDKTSVGTNGNPQFRITHTPTQTSPNIPGKYTDFHTTNLGDLNIDPRDDSQGNPSVRDRFVGIHTNTPGNSLEINSQLAGPATPNGNAGVPSGAASGFSGLRFSDLNSNSVPQANPSANNGVLSVDANGDVIYVPGGGNISGNSGIFINNNVAQLGVPCTSPAQVKNQNAINVDRVLRLNANFIFGDGGNLGVGFFVGGAGMNCAPGNKVEISATQGNPYHPNPAPGINGASGFRLRHLTSNNTPLVNGVNGVNNAKVLTVDQNGDVVLVTPAGGGGGGTANQGLQVSAGNVQLGGDCSNNNEVTAAQLSTNRKVLMNNNHILLSVPAGNTGKVGIGDFPPGSCLPGNLLEVKKGATSNVSGLRLTDLANATPGTGNGNVLTVNGQGDVILVPDATGGGGGGINQAQNGLSLNGLTIVELGGPLGNAAPATLLNNREVPMNNQGLFLTGNGRLGLNTNLAQAALTVEQNTGLSGHPAILGSPQVGAVSTMKTTFSGGVVSFFGLIDPAVTSHAYAVYGKAITNTTSDNVGVVGEAGRTTTGPIANYIGVRGISETASGAFNEGGRFSANNSGIRNWGLRAQAPSSNGGSIDNYAGRFDGDIFITGAGFINGGTPITSDQMFKTNIDSVANATGIIKQLKPKTFYYDTANIYGLGFSKSKQFGFIAQDVQQILPELVSTVNKSPDYNDLGAIINPAVSYKTVNYNALFAIIVKAMQQQQRQIEKQDSLIQVLSQAINNCCQNQNTKQTGIIGNGPAAKQQIANQLNVDLSDKEVVVLNQNVPNPFAEHTVITYNIPQEYKFAQIIFKTTDGKIIKAVDLEKGRGQLNVFASDLSNGMYMYTLIVDGKSFDTKKMIKQ